MLWHIHRQTGGDAAIHRHINHFGTVEIRREHHGAGFAGVTLDHALFLQCSQMAHGGSLAGKAEVPLDLASGGHHAVLTLIVAQVLQELRLAAGQRFVVVG